MKQQNIDQYYPYKDDSLKLNRQETLFKGFKAENIQSSTNIVVHNAGIGDQDDLEKIRIRRYQDQKGLFLVHTWRPSMTPGQVADIVIWLHQHGEGPMSKGEVERVEYQLGPKFFKTSQVKTNANDQYRIEVSAYGPMLCVAKVFLKGQGEPILLKRYVNFDGVPNNTFQRTANHYR